MEGPSAASAGPAGAPQQQEMHRIRLRLHHGGAFVQVPETGEWRYMGGSAFNETLPRPLAYSELCQRVNAKVGEACSIRYLSPGDALHPDQLVNVTDDDDVQELYAEYLDALKWPGTAQRTFRIHVFLQAALQFEIERATDDEARSLCCYDEPDFPDDYGSDVQSSCDPSSDTAAWQASQAASAVGGLGASHGVTPQLPLQHAAFVACWPASDGGVAPRLHTPAPRVDPRQAPHWEQHALGNLSLSLQQQQQQQEKQQQLQRQRQGHLRTAVAFYEEPQVEDPYGEEEEDPSAPPARPAQGYRGGAEAWGEVHGGRIASPANPAPTAVVVKPDTAWGTAHDNTKNGQSLYSMPLARVRDAASGLPSHISAFGDSRGGGDKCGGVGSLQLPSHISAFGEGAGGGQGDAHMPTSTGLAVGGLQEWDTSRCVTQEFAAQPQLLQPLSGGNDGSMSASLGAGNVEGRAGVGPTAGQSVSPRPTLSCGGNMQHVPRSAVVETTKVGEGAFGEVSCADVFPYGTVAIKWLKKDRFSKYSESFQREAEVLARLNHPHIIRMFGLVVETPGSNGGGSAGGGSGAGASGAGSTPCQSPPPAPPAVAGIMMEYIRGGSLAQRLRALSGAGRGSMGLRERTRIALQAALGMSYLHDQNPAVIHFDLKPDNLLLEGEGEGLLVKVADFGLSKHKIQSYVTCHDLRGTLPYMAPELVRCPHQVCEKCDVWSMGVVMWEMATLEVPFQELTAQDILRALMAGNLRLRPPSRGCCEPEWAALIAACMQPEPDARPSFRQLAERLEELHRRAPLESQLSRTLSHPSPGAAAPPAASPAAAGASGRSQTTAAAAAATAAAVAHVLQLQHAQEQQHHHQQQQQQQAVAVAAAALNSAQQWQEMDALLNSHAAQQHAAQQQAAQHVLAAAAAAACATPQLLPSPSLGITPLYMQQKPAAAMTPGMTPLLEYAPTPAELFGGGGGDMAGQCFDLVAFSHHAPPMDMMTATAAAAAAAATVAHGQVPTGLPLLHHHHQGVHPQQAQHQGGLLGPHFQYQLLF